MCNCIVVPPDVPAPAWDFGVTIHTVMVVADAERGGCDAVLFGVVSNVPLIGQAIPNLGKVDHGAGQLADAIRYVLSGGYPTTRGAANSVSWL